MRYGLMLGLVAFGLVGCGGDAAEEATKKQNKWLTAAKCKTDKDCAKGFICNGEDGKKTCGKGERTAAEKAATKKAKNEARKKKQEAARTPDAGHGRLYVRICPFFKNTPESIGTITAVSQTTKKKQQIHLALVTPDQGYRDEFVFRSLPPGKYDVTATYGIQKGGKPNVAQLRCDLTTKLPCRDDLVREIDVVLPKDEPPVEKNEKGKVKKRPCDFIAE